jgi:hypothetical protein
MESRVTDYQDGRVDTYWEMVAVVSMDGLFSQKPEQLHYEFSFSMRIRFVLSGAWALLFVVRLWNFVNGWMHLWCSPSASEDRRQAAPCLFLSAATLGLLFKAPHDFCSQPDISRVNFSEPFQLECPAQIFYPSMLPRASFYLFHLSSGTTVLYSPRLLVAVITGPVFYVKWFALCFGFCTSAFAALGMFFLIGRWSNVDETQKHTKLQKPNTLYDSMYRKYLE